MHNDHKLLFSKTIQVRWHDMDAYNHVNHSNYFVYMQECRIDWLRYHGVQLEQLNIVPVVASAQCKYIRPIKYPATIIVELFLLEICGKKLHLLQQVRSSEEILYAVANITVVWFDSNTQSSVLMPDEYNYILNDIR